MILLALLRPTPKTHRSDVAWPAPHPRLERILCLGRYLNGSRATFVTPPLDESNVRKMFNRILDAAGLRRRGPHQMRHSFASQLLAAGEPITYVSQQLGHGDASITLRVYAHWLPDTTARKGVDRLDETAPDGAQTAPRAIAVNEQMPLSRLDGVVSRVGIEPTTRRLRVCCSAN